MLPSPQARFDFVEATSKGYRFVWHNRVLVGKLAGIPVLVKLGCLALIIALELSGNFLRQGLILLPSYFLEGWMLAYLVRTAIYDERGSSSLSGNQSQDEVFLRERARAILAATLVYVLIKLVLSFSTGMVMDFQRSLIGENGQSLHNIPDPSPGMMLVALALLGFFLWAFRYLWMNVSVALGYGFREYALKFRGGMISFYMIGTWLLCFVPFALVLVLCSELLLSVIPAQDGEPTALYRFLMTGVQAAVDTAISLVTAIAMAFGIREVMDGKSKK